MRNYVQFQAGQRRGLGFMVAIRRAWTNRRLRKDLRKLQAMDDNMLRDIGLTRENISSLLRLPASVDLRWESERLRLLSTRAAVPATSYDTRTGKSSLEDA